MISNRPAAEALASWLVGQPLGLSATLTFLPKLTGPPGSRPLWLNVDHARQAVRHYVRRLDRIAFGRSGERKGRRLAVAVVREGGESWDSKHLHYHLAGQVPDRYSPEDWAGAARDEWLAMDWASPSQNVFKPVWSSEGWISYVLKDRDKPVYLDAMDFESWHLV